MEQDSKQLSNEKESIETSPQISVRNLSESGNLNWQVTCKPILVYPNSGETYDGETKQWLVSFLL